MPGFRQALPKMFLVIAIVIASWFLLRVKQVDCQVQAGASLVACDQQLSQLVLANAKNKPLLFLDLKSNLEVSPGIFGHFLIKKISKTWPYKLQVQLEPDTLIYQLQTDQDVQAFSLSQVANKLPTQDAKLPLVKGLKTPISPQTHQKLVEVIKTLDANKLKEVTIDLHKPTETQVQVGTPPLNIVINFNQDRPLAGLEAVLQSQELAQLQASQVPITIDLRFKLPVLHSE